MTTVFKVAWISLIIKDIEKTVQIWIKPTDEMSIIAILTSWFFYPCTMVMLPCPVRSRCREESCLQFVLKQLRGKELYVCMCNIYIYVYMCAYRHIYINIKSTDAILQNYTTSLILNGHRVYIYTYINNYLYI